MELTHESSPDLVLLTGWHASRELGPLEDLICPAMFYTVLEVHETRLTLARPRSGSDVVVSIS
jgi:hypothetical protein